VSRRPQRPDLGFHGITALLAIVGLLATAAPARAHRICAEAKQDGDTIRVEAFYDDNTPAVDARVTVHAADAAEMADGRTDAQGRWQFAKPGPGVYCLVVDAGAGHRAEVELKIQAAPAGPVTVSEGPDRADATRTPWERIALGFAIIAVLTGVSWALARRAPRSRRPRPQKADQS
jgi:hypothetical protein